MSAGVPRQILTNICRSATMWPKTWSATFACWWLGTTADKWDFVPLTALSFKNLFVMNCYESYWWLHHSKEWWKYGFMPFWWTTLNNQVPTKVCNQEEVPLCTKQEMAETKKVAHYNDIRLEKFQWSTTHYTGVRECPHGGLPRHRWEVHTRCLRL